MVKLDEGGNTPGSSGSGYTTVDPGQIRKFAELLDEITQTVNDGPKQRVDSFPTNDDIFGAYNASSTNAQAKHDDMVKDARTFWKRMHERLGNLATGTHNVAGAYTDLAALNEASSTDIDSALANPKA